MTPLAKIKKGIENDSWELVVEGYEDLTGEDLGCSQLDEGSCKEEITTRPSLDQFTRSIKKNKPLLDKVDVEKVFGPEIEFKEHPVKTNKFRPEDYEAETSKELKELEFINDQITPTPRKRQETKKIPVYCLNCDQDINFIPSLVKPNPELEDKVVPKGCKNWMYCEYGDHGKKCPYRNK